MSVKRRQDWLHGRLDLDPERLVFIDETWASTNMARQRGRAPKGERLLAAIPHGHWKTATFVTGLRLSSMMTPMVLDGPINRDAFQAYIDQVLVPDLKPGASSSWTTSRATRAPTFARRSRRRAQCCSTCRPTVQTSTLSKTPLLN